MKNDVSRRLIDFLDDSPTCYQAIENLSSQLRKKGYAPLRESERWTLERGGKYFVTRGESSLIAFRLPAGELRGFMLTASHSDSPTFKLRQNAEVPSAGNTVRLSVEGYGGAIMRSWLDKPLSVAGRVFVKEGAGIASKLIDIDRDLLVIPSLAIHMNREMNKGVELKANVDMLPLFAAAGEEGAFRRLVAEAAGVGADDVVSTELFLYPRTPGTLVGLNEEFIASPRLDDLECVFCCYTGFVESESEPSASAPLFCVFNNEEVGSGSRQGANSTFLEDTVGRICESLGMSADERGAAVADSFMISADNAHAIHPAHSEYADGNEFPVLNGGVVIKYNAAQKYTTDGLSGAVFTRLCELAGVPVQRYSNRADLPGGSTLGNISGSHLSVPTVDIGLPQLAMHSCCEVGGVKDAEYLIEAARAFYGKSFRHGADGRIELE